jgi:hypothetical protein
MRISESGVGHSLFQMFFQVGARACLTPVFALEGLPPCPHIYTMPCPSSVVAVISKYHLVLQGQRFKFTFCSYECCLCEVKDFHNSATLYWTAYRRKLRSDFEVNGHLMLGLK